MWLLRAVQHMLHVVAWVQIFVAKYDSWSANEWQKCAVPWKSLGCFRLLHFPTGEKWGWMKHVQQHIEMKTHFLDTFQVWMSICGRIRTSHVSGWPAFWEQFCAHICLKTIFSHPKFRCAAIATSVRVFCNQAKEADTSKGQQCVWNMPINDTPKVLTSVHDPRESWDAGDREPRQMIWIKCLFF